MISFIYYLRVMANLSQILEYNSYSVSTRIFLVILMLVPAITNFIMLMITHDAIYSTAALILIGYSIPLLIMHYLVDRLISVRAFTKDMDDRDIKIKKGLVNGLVIGFFLGLILVGYSILFSWGPQSIVLPMPAYFGNRFYYYWIGFFILWVIILPIFEGIFFFMYQASSWNQTGSDVLICLLYALMNFTWLIYVVETKWALILLSCISFFVGYLCIWIRDKSSGFESLGIRIGISIGTYILLVYLNSGSSHKSPMYYLRADSRNKF